MRLWSSAQDSAEQSCHPGRAARENRHGESAEGRAAGVGGFRDPEHLVRRAPQPHDSPRFGVLAPSLALPRPWRRPAPRTRRTPALLLQFHPAAQRLEVRPRDQNASDAGRFGEHTTELERHLHGARSLSSYSCGGHAFFRDRPAHRNWHSRAVDVLVAARTTNGGLINSEWRKHPSRMKWKERRDYTAVGHGQQDTRLTGFTPAAASLSHTGPCSGRRAPRRGAPARRAGRRTASC